MERAGLRDALANVVRSSTKGQRACELELETQHRAHPALELGQRFTMHRDCCESQTELERVYEVVRVNQGSATVKALNARHVEVKGSDGEIKAAWDAPSKGITISVHASVVLVSA